MPLPRLLGLQPTVLGTPSMDTTALDRILPLTHRPRTMPGPLHLPPANLIPMELARLSALQLSAPLLDT